MSSIASQITSLTIVYSAVYSGADQRKHQSSASLAFVRGSHRGPVNSPHKWPVTRKMFPFDDVIVDTEWENSEQTWLEDVLNNNSYDLTNMQAFWMETSSNMCSEVWKHKKDGLRMIHIILAPSLFLNFKWIELENITSAAIVWPWGEQSCSEISCFEALDNKHGNTLLKYYQNVHENHKTDKKQTRDSFIVY